MAKRFKYSVCQVQAGHVTYVNGRWQGNQALAGAAMEQLIRTCPVLWEYLNAVGREGWELISVVRQSSDAGDPASSVYHYLMKKEEQ
jgi:hypothetical protein